MDLSGFIPVFQEEVLEKKLNVKRVRKWNNRPLSYGVEGEEGGKYLRTGMYVCHVVSADFSDDE